MTELRVENGFPMALGANLVEGGVNFCIYSRDAAKIWLCLFENADSKEELSLKMILNKKEYLILGTLLDANLMFLNALPRPAIAHYCRCLQGL